VGSAVRSSAPGAVGKGAAPVPSRLRGEAKPLRGRWADPLELAFQLPRTVPMDWPGAKAPEFTSPSPACLLTTALTRSAVTAQEVECHPCGLDDLIPSFVLKVRRARAILTHIPIHSDRAHLSRAVPQESGILRGQYVRAWRSVESIIVKLRAAVGRRFDTYHEAVQDAREAQLAERRRA
jgi:hypothetical protein